MRVICQVSEACTDAASRLPSAVSLRHEVVSEKDLLKKKKDAPRCQESQCCQGGRKRDSGALSAFFTWVLVAEHGESAIAVSFTISPLSAVD
jgi:hypothetical protein